MKKVLATVLVIILIFTATPFSSFNLKANAKYEDYYNYTVLNNEAIITSCEEKLLGGNVTIPSTLGGYPVTSIGNRAFAHSPYIKGIIIPDSVTSIGEYAFYDCTELENIELPNEATTIGYYAFYDTKFYNNPENWENEVLYTDNYLIKAQTSISGSYTIKNQTIGIADQAFSDCKNLESITIPDSITTISLKAFYNCENLKTLNLGKNVTKINSSAFSGCSRLDDIYYNNSYRNKMENLYFGNTNTCLVSATWHYAITDDLLYEYDETNLLATVSGCNESAMDVIVPASITKNGKTYTVTKIGASAFFRNLSIRSIIIADTVTEIESAAFSGCTGLGSVTLGKGLKSIGNLAFYNCAHLGNIIIPKSVTSIGKNIFKNCDIQCFCYKDSYAASYMTENDLPYIYMDGIDKENVFSGKYNGYNWSLDKATGVLEFTGSGQSSDFSSANASWAKYSIYITSVKLPKGITIIANNTFKNFSNLKSIELPDSVVTIGASAFEGCTKLESITLKNGLTTIDNSAFSYCSSLKSITIPESVTEIYPLAFENCLSLTTFNFNAINCNMGDAFKNCPNLKYINTGDKVESISENAFKNCENIESIVMSDSVKSIGKYAFYNCKSLENIRLSENLTLIEDYAFSSCTNLKNITLPKSLYKLGKFIFSSCSELQRIDVAENNRYFSSIDGILFNKAQTDLILFPQNRTETSYTIPETVESIADCAFSHCDNLESIDLSVNLKNIGEAAFNYCGNITSIAIPYGVREIKDSTFYRCDKLKRITIYNPNCVFDKYCGIAKSTIIYGVINSTAQEYADELLTGFIDVDLVHTHTFGEATCTTPKFCSVCATPSGTEFGHKYSSSCDFTCDVCNNERIPPHNYSDDCDTDCDLCGNERTPPHSYTNNCDADCNICGKERTVLPHLYLNDCDSVCNICGESREVPPHIYTDNCDNDCNVCGETRTAPHKYTNVCDGNCDLCGWYRASYHKYTNDCDNICNLCGAKRAPSPHSYTNFVNLATFSKDGKNVKKCIFCGKISSQSVIKKIKSVTLSSTAYTYNGKVKTPAVTAKDSDGKVIPSKYYTVSYSSGRVNVGTYKVTVKFKGNYSGSQTLSFKINPSSKLKVSLISNTYSYNGTVKTPDIMVNDSSGNIISSKYYTVSYSSGRVKVGTYKVTVKFKGNYSGSQTRSFKITPASTSRFSVSLSNTSYTYNGTVKKPAVTVKDSTGKRLSAANYTVSYQSGRKNVGKYKVTVKFKGNYSGTRCLYFKILPPKSAISKLSSGKNSLTVTISKKTTQVTGYQIHFSTDKKFKYTKQKNIVGHKKTKYTFKGLLAKRYYYVRVRTFKKIGNTTLYSNWSTIKRIKTK